jgi:hypothetical protein
VNGWFRVGRIGSYVFWLLVILVVLYACSAGAR